MLHRISQSQRFGALLFGVALLLGSLLFTGCTDGIFSVEDTAEMSSLSQGGKFRQAHLLDRALRYEAGKSASGGELGLIVALPDGIDKQRIFDRYKIFQRYRVFQRYEYDNVLYGFAWSIEDTLGADYQDFLDALTADPEILWFEPDFDVNSPLSSAAQSGSGQQVPWSVAAVGGTTSWAVSGDGSGSVNVDVFILDTGISNTDLNVVERIDFRDGFNNTRDFDGHGTHVAGIVGAVDDADGLVGLAPGANIHNYKVLGDDGRGDVSQVLAAIEHITTMKLAKGSKPMVVNLSLGEDVGNNVYSALDDAVSASVSAGVVYVVAAGNHGKNASSVTPAKVASAITVGAYAFDGSYADFSNYGPKVDILAPGEGVVSLSNGNGAVTISPASGAGTPVEMSGTSMAAAHVTGAVALYLGQNPSATPAQVEQALLDGAMDFVTGAPSSTTTKSVWVGTPQTYRDAFDSRVYNGSHGTLDWSGSAWTELDEPSGNGVTDGPVQVSPNNTNCLSPNCLRVGGTKPNNPDPGFGVSRDVDLGGALTATLSFSYRRGTFGDPVATNGTMTLDISDNGGSTWTTLKTYYFNGTDNAQTAESFDISAYASANSRIRFLTHGPVDDIVFFIDNIEIELNGSGGAGQGNGNGGGNGNGNGGGNGTPTTFEKRVSSDNDEAEENSSGDMYRDSSDLELVEDGGDQLVGMRFTGVSIPQGATITNAYIQFTVDETDSGIANLTFRGQDADDADAFSSSDDDISDRPTTSASASWSPAAWNSVGAAGADQRTPDLSAIIQEIVNRGGWSSGNDLVLIVSGTGERTAESYDGSASKAPLLHIEYQP